MYFVRVIEYESLEGINYRNIYDLFKMLVFFWVGLVVVSLV